MADNGFSLVDVIPDLVVVATLLISALLAFSRGFIRELLTIAGLIGAIAAAIYGYPHLAPYAQSLVHDPRIASLAAGCVLFVVALIFFGILGSALGRLVNAAQLNAVDRSLGFAFGLVRGAAILSLAWIGLTFIWSTEELPSPIAKARTRPLVEAGAELLAPVATLLKPLLFPGTTGEEAAAGIREAEKTARQAVETEQLLRKMMAPEPKGADGPAPGGYDAKERKDLERLIESSGSRP